MEKDSARHGQLDVSVGHVKSTYVYKLCVVRNILHAEFERTINEFGESVDCVTRCLQQ
jgi:hypothetical protein